MKIQNVNQLLDFENKICNERGYTYGGYYKNQENNQDIYKILKKILLKMDLSWFKSKHYKLLEDENYHSLNALIEDIKKEEELSK